MRLAERGRDLLLALGGGEGLPGGAAAVKRVVLVPPAGEGCVHDAEVHSMVPGCAVAVPGQHQWDDLAIVVRERGANRVEGAELPLEASAARQIMREREAREGQVSPACESHNPSPQVRHGHHERDSEVVEPIRLLYVGGKEGCDAFMPVPQAALPSLGARDAEATGPPMGPGVAGGGRVLGPSPSARAPPNSPRASAAPGSSNKGPGSHRTASWAPEQGARPWL